MRNLFTQFFPALKCFCALVALSILPSAGAQMYDAANDFSAVSNPNGVWAYGFKPRPDQAFQLYDIPSNRGGDLDFWYSSQFGVDPCVGHNSHEDPRRGCPTCEYYADPGQLVFHPGRSQLSVVQWTSPRNGTYDVTIGFLGVGRVSTVGTYVYLNDQQLYVAPLRGRGQTGEFADRLFIRLGGRIEAAVDCGPDGTYADTTGLTFTVHPLPSPRRAVAVARVVNGFVVEITLTDSGDGFTEPPHVEIVGTGTGALARATVEDGRVTSISVLSAGAGYDDSTLVKIDPPHKSPSVSIRTQTVRLTFSVWRGIRYQVQASADLKSWQPVWEFVAEEDTVSHDFDVTETGRFFGVVELPP